MSHLFIPRSLFVDDTTIHMHAFGGAWLSHGGRTTWLIYSSPCKNRVTSWPAVVDDFGNLVAVK